VVTRRLAQKKAEASIARMHLHPAEVVGDTAWSSFFLLLQFVIYFVLWKVQKLSVVCDFLYKIVHWGDVTSKQFVDATISFILTSQKIFS